jgi:hypothetical protein
VFVCTRLYRTTDTGPSIMGLSDIGFKENYRLSSSETFLQHNHGGLKVKHLVKNKQKFVLPVSLTFRGDMGINYCCAKFLQFNIKLFLNSECF